MAIPLTRAEIQLFAESMPDDMAEALLASTWARAVKVAPCLADMTWTDDVEDSEGWANTQLVKSVLRDAILRRDEQGAGAVSARQAGDYGETLRSNSGLFRPSEIAELQALCAEYRKDSATTVLPWDWDTGPQVHPFLLG